MADFLGVALYLSTAKTDATSPLRKKKGYTPLRTHLGVIFNVCYYLSDNPFLLVKLYPPFNALMTQYFNIRI